MYQPPPKKAVDFLMRRHSVTEDFIMPYGIMIFPAGIPGIAFYGINNSVLNSFDNSYMVGYRSV